MERIVSPGVFTRENDLSFLPAGIAAIGACVIGPTPSGPAMEPVLIESPSDFVKTFGDGDGISFVPYTVKSYLKNSGRVTVVRIPGYKGYSNKTFPIIACSGSYGSASVVHPASGTQKIVAVLAPINGTSATSVGDAIIDAITISGSVGDYFVVNVAGKSYSCSFDPSDKKYIEKVFGAKPDGGASVYVYADYEGTAQTLADAGTYSIIPEMLPAIYKGVIDLDESDDAVLSGVGMYSTAHTPWVRTQDLSGEKYNIFRLNTLSIGQDQNKKYKITIEKITQPIENAAYYGLSEYGTFALAVRAFGDTDNRKDIIEYFTGLSLDPNDPKYYVRVIGDQYKTFDDGKITVHGDYTNKSKIIRVEVADVNAIPPKNAIPWGFGALKAPFSASSVITALLPLPVYKTTQWVTATSESNSRTTFGFDASAADNVAYCAPCIDDPGGALDWPAIIATKVDLSDNCSKTSIIGGTITTVSMSVNDTTGSNSIAFTFPFFGGFDGIDPTKRKYTGKDITSTNLFGLDCSGPTKEGVVAYRAALDIISNPDEYDINMLITPGVLHGTHGSITDYAMNVCEERQDCFYLMDNGLCTDSIATVVENVQSMNSNYVGCYYPWVKILDPLTNRYLWVSPSVVMAGVIAFNDKVAAEWYAPAGLNRGGIVEAVQAYNRLTHADRDTLYEGRVNPIATFPGQGIVAWGQKTLQVKASALDRINVRRLLIALKKFIASSSRYLLFEQNTTATRNRFLSIVNPYLESVKQRYGLYAFKVQMDEGNNTPDIIDRNMLVGEIWLQPAKAAEFIVIDFNIMRTGASFPGGA
jgi:hypothetical protein